MAEEVSSIGRHIDTYRLVRRLGEGTFGKVYLAEDLRNHTEVAVKMLKVQLSSGRLNNFEVEVRILFRLTHPHIVRLRDFSLTSNPPFLVMEYAPGGTLRQRHPSGTSVPLPLVCSYVQQVAAALQYAHRQGVIHRDVKPENMLLAADANTIWLSDFGVTAIAHSEHSLSTLARRWRSLHSTFKPFLRLCARRCRPYHQL